MPKKVAVGVVTSDRMSKTRVVEIPRLVKHPMYGKFIRQRTVCYVHDEDEGSAVGDKVEIIESRPRSKKKRWELVRVLEKSRAVDLAALRTAASEAGAAPTDQGNSDQDNSDQGNSDQGNSDQGNSQS
jgi:small subunit ribosomal protein S17